MAEGNVSSPPKKRCLTSEQGIQFSLNVELPHNQESRLLGMKDRIKMTKSCLNLSKATSCTQNADLLEALLLAFEEKVQRSKETSCVSSLLANQLSSSACTSSSSKSPQSFPRPVATSTPTSRTSLAFDDPVPVSVQVVTSRFFGLKHFRYRHRQHKMTLSTSLVKEPYALCFHFLQPKSRRSAVFVVRSMMNLFHSKGRVVQCL